jgi:hypothetical protein
VQHAVGEPCERIGESEKSRSTELADEQAGPERRHVREEPTRGQGRLVVPTARELPAATRRRRDDEGGGQGPPELVRIGSSVVVHDWWVAVVAAARGQAAE